MTRFYNTGALQAMPCMQVITQNAPGRNERAESHCRRHDQKFRITVVLWLQNVKCRVVLEGGAIHGVKYRHTAHNTNTIIPPQLLCLECIFVSNTHSV